MGAIKVECHRCHSEVEQCDMRIDSDGRSIICTECYDAHTKALRPEQRERDALSELGITPITPQEEEMLMTGSPSEFVILGSGSRPTTYMCQDCNFKFTRKSIIASKYPCPFCGNRSVKEYMDRFSAEKLLREADQREF